jgi:hypothetical protein
MIEKAMSKYNRKDPKFVSKSPKREWFLMVILFTFLFIIYFKYLYLFF